MSRIRSIHPGFFTDENLVVVSMAARLLFLGLGVEADDKGIFEWKPLTLKMRIFPADNVNMVELLDELTEADAVTRYEMVGRAYGAIRNFRKFQKPKTPNNIHPISPIMEAYVGLISEMNGGKVDPFPPKGEKSFQMEEGGGKMEDEEELEPIGSCASGDAPLTVNALVGHWNALAGQCDLPKVVKLTERRKRQASARLREYPDRETWLKAFANIRASPHCLGNNDRGWKADFDFLLQDKSFTRLIEGSYGNGRSETNRAGVGPAPSRDGFSRALDAVILAGRTGGAPGPAGQPDAGSVAGFLPLAPPAGETG